MAEPLDSASDVAGWACCMYWTLLWPSFGPPAKTQIIASYCSSDRCPELMPVVGNMFCASSLCTIGSSNFGLRARSESGGMGLPVKAEVRARIGEQPCPPLGIVAAFSLVGWQKTRANQKKECLVRTNIREMCAMWFGILRKEM